MNTDTAIINAVASQAGPGIQQTLALVYVYLQPFIWPILLGLITWGISILKKHGYSTRYATAIARALGAGVMAAKDAGLDPFGSAVGRAMVIATGAKYLEEHVGDAGKAIGIDTIEGHAERVSAEMGSVIGKAEAAALTVVKPAVSEVTSQLQFPGLGAH